MLISDTAIKNRSTVGVLMLLIVAAGTFSYLTLPREAAPDVKIPIILVTTTHEGVSPEDIENTITREIEKELSGVNGLKELTSTSAEGTSLIQAEFYPDVEIEDALQRVRDKIDLAKAELPDDAEEPIIKDINIAEFPILMINISGPISPVRLKAIADELEDAVEALPGVLNVDVLGALEREIRLEIDPDRLAGLGLTIPEILRLVPSENVNVSAGGLETPGTKFNVRVPAEFAEPEEVETLQIASRGGKPIYLLDVARVRDTFKDRTSFSRLDGVNSITVSVQKRVGADIVPIAEAVKFILAEARRRAPLGTEFQITLDRSKDIRMMVADLENNIASGLVLVVLVLVLFMGWRTSLIVALAIPMSMLISFAAIQALGYTLNMIVLFSLILALGMLVDNAIVIVENIFRHMELGYGRIDAAMKGTGEVAWPVITSTATTIAAFSPLLFWPDVMGDFMKYIPVTLIITLTSSLFVAMVISPTICSFVGGGRRHTRKKPMGRFVRGYRGLLDLAIRHRLVTVSLAVLLLGGLVIVYVRRGRGVELFPQFDPRRAVINIRTPQGTGIDKTDRLGRIVERRIEPYRLTTGDVDRVVTNVGASGGGFFGGSSGAHVGNLTILFHDFDERKRPSAQAISEMREVLWGISGAEIKLEKERHGPPTGAAVTVRIIGEDFRILEKLSERAKALISDVPGLVNLRSDLEATRPEIVFRPDRVRAAQLGVNTFVIGQFLKTAVFGMKVGTYRQFNDEYDITVRLPPEHRRRIDDLFRLGVPNDEGTSIPLSSLGNFEYRGGFGTIHRVDQKRTVMLTGDSEGRLSDVVLRDVRKRLESLNLPPGYRIQYAGEKEEMEKASAFLKKAFILAVILIVLILVGQFNTLSVPLIIMTTVILSMIGVLTGLLINRMPFGIIMTGIGVISLAGVVVNNAIVLLSYTRQLQRGGSGAIEAAIQAGITRLRPVLLTAATTILGLIPMATGVSFDFHTMQWATRSESSQWWASIAWAVIYGLGFATLLTLVFVPALYVTIYRALVRLGLGGLRKVGDRVDSKLQPQPEKEY